MSEGIIIAIISGVVTIIGAIIALFAKSASKKAVIKQKQKGNNNTQIGIQNINIEDNNNG